MAKLSEVLDFTQTIVSAAVKHGMMQQFAEDEVLDGRHVRLGGREVVNFGSCSYLGLEMHPALREGVIDAVTRFGTQFSSSRLYMSSPLTRELEQRLSELFGGPTLVAPTTSLGHQAVLPALITGEDAVILDQQVHHSVQVAANLLRPQGTHVEIVRHNRMDLLEERVQALSHTHRHVWYMADGVYSMYADFAPLETLELLRERYAKLHYYLDDSHGMSWYGEKGRGVVLSEMKSRERLVVACSLNKAFACAGGAIVFPGPESFQRVRDCGGPLTFSGPVQPPMLGAALASVKLHLSGEVEAWQAKLQERVRTFNQLAAEHHLPLVALSEAPIRTIGLGQPQVAFKMGERLLAEGFFVNLAIFPGVSSKYSGLRITVTTHQTLEDIRALVETIARLLPQALAEEGTSVQAVQQLFGLPEALPVAAPSLASVNEGLELTVSAPRLSLSTAASIDALDAAEWDRLMGGRGPFSVAGLRFLERTFGVGAGPGNHWKFHYYLVRDDQRKVVLATFATETLWKDDMLASAEASQRIEERRANDPAFLTSRVLTLGSLLTEGEHLYLDRAGDWRGALRLLTSALAAEQAHAPETERPNTLLLRDFASNDKELDDWMLGAGFTKFPMPTSYVTPLACRDEEGFMASLSYNRRKQQRKKIRRFDDRFEVEVLRAGETRTLTDEEVARCYELYGHVQARGRELNTFPLPTSLFANLNETPGYEVLLLRLSSAYGGSPDAPPVGVAVGFVAGEAYTAMLLGVDYAHVEKDGLYRQCLRHLLLRAIAHRCRQIRWGMSAEEEKLRFGAVPEKNCAYVQIQDLYATEYLAQLEADVGRA